MKTGLEHFMCFGPKLAKLCIEASKKSQNGRNLDKNWESPDRAVIHCIRWATTEQGAGFWNGFIRAFDYDRYNKSDGSSRESQLEWKEGHELGKEAKKKYEDHQRAFP